MYRRLGGRIQLIRLWQIVSRLLLLAALPLFGCEGGQQQLVGKWNKTTERGCAVFYPATIEFFEDGEYTGNLPNWSGGKYRVVSGRRLRLDTSTGPGVYEFRTANETLTFKNDMGCEFKYTKGR